MGNILGALPRVREARASGSISPANPQKDVLVQPTNGIADIPVQYTFTNVEGAFTLEELVDMEDKKDARMQRIRTRELPREFWPLLRARRNRRRALRRKIQRKQKAAKATAKENSSFNNDASHSNTSTDPAVIEAAIAAQLERQRILDEAFKNGMRIVVDCSFSTTSGDREVRSLTRQLQYCLAANRRAVRPAQLIFCGFSGSVQEFGESKMGASGWNAHLHEEPAYEVIPTDAKVIVLSPDADEPLDAIDPDTTYIVGGLVDRTIQKGATAKFAIQQNWPARRLPLQEHFGRSAVLNVNDAVAALLLVHGGLSWSEALGAAVPHRRQCPKKHRRWLQGQHQDEQKEPPKPAMKPHEDYYWATEKYADNRF